MSATALHPSVAFPPVLVEVTDHAAERYRQRVRGTMQAKTEIAARVSRAYDAGRHERSRRGLLVRDLEAAGLVFVCRPDHGSLIVVSLWEDDDETARVPKRFTDALRGEDHELSTWANRDR
ncbi:MAG: hypothetical protein AAGC46_19995, partial [Solirubrobacteraceae bacterium]